MAVVKGHQLRARDARQGLGRDGATGGVSLPVQAIGEVQRGEGRRIVARVLDLAEQAPSDLFDLLRREGGLSHQLGHQPEAERKLLAPPAAVHLRGLVAAARVERRARCLHRFGDGVGPAPPRALGQHLEGEGREPGQRDGIIDRPAGQVELHAHQG